MCFPRLFGYIFIYDFLLTLRTPFLIDTLVAPIIVSVFRTYTT